MTTSVDRTRVQALPNRRRRTRFILSVSLLCAVAVFSHFSIQNILDTLPYVHESSTAVIRRQQAAALAWVRDLKERYKNTRAVLMVAPQTPEHRTMSELADFMDDVIDDVSADSGNGSGGESGSSAPGQITDPSFPQQKSLERSHVAQSDEGTKLGVGGGNSAATTQPVKVEESEEVEASGAVHVSHMDRLVDATWHSHYLTEHHLSMALISSPHPTFLYIPRFGLGNSLRGYCSSYLFSVLSGRRLVRLHYGPHGQVFDLLCSAFECPKDGIPLLGPDGTSLYTRYKNEARPLALDHSVNASTLFGMLAHTQPAIWANSPKYFDHFWTGEPNILACVYALFDCSSLWCVRTRAVHHLLGAKPSEELRATIEGMMEANVVEEGREAKMKVPKGMGLKVRFDIAVHFRTRPRIVEKYRRSQDCDLSDRKCIRKAGRRVEGERSSVRLYSTPEFWDCLGSHVEELRREVAKRHGTDSKLHIFVATDNEEMRPQFVSRLLKFGTVWYSTGNVIHMSKQSRSSQKMPTAAEFYLLSKADHILQAGGVISTFAEFAAQLGNGTLLIPKQYTPNCRFKYIHRGVSSR